MKRFYLQAVLVLLASFAPVAAQGNSTPTGPQATSKIAVIFSGAFQDAKNGIARFAAAITKLNGEFQKTQDDLTATAARLRTQQDEITKMQQSPTATPAQIQARIEQLDQAKKDYQRKGEDAQAAYQRRRNELLMPLQEDVGKALDAFAQARGITMVLDGSQVPIIYAIEGIDITRAFIADYNSKNPAAASATPPRP
jgi:Skp family chaperone for outer membrane proteins